MRCRILEVNKIATETKLSMVAPHSLSGVFHVENLMLAALDETSVEETMLKRSFADVGNCLKHN